MDDIGLSFLTMLGMSGLALAGGAVVNKIFAALVSRLMPERIARIEKAHRGE